MSEIRHGLENVSVFSLCLGASGFERRSTVPLPPSNTFFFPPLLSNKQVSLAIYQRCHEYRMEKHRIPPFLSPLGHPRSKTQA